jgi:uncharacterized Zn-finger protein
MAQLSPPKNLCLFHCGSYDPTNLSRSFPRPYQPTTRYGTMDLNLYFLVRISASYFSSQLVTTVSKAGAKRYHCRYVHIIGCGKTFATSSHASRHSKIHVSRKLVSCTFVGCIKNFTREDNMKTHFESHHTNRRFSRRRRTHQNCTHQNFYQHTIVAQNHGNVGQGPTEQLQALGSNTLTKGGIIDDMIQATESNALAGWTRWSRLNTLATVAALRQRA